MSKNPEIGSYIDYITDYYLGVRLRMKRNCELSHTKLKRYDIEPEDIQNLIAKKLDALKKYNLINDLTFAKVYVDEKTRFKQRGEYRIKVGAQKKKGISDSIISLAFEFREEQDADILPRLLMFKYKNTDWNDPKAKQRAIQGFSDEALGYIK